MFELIALGITGVVSLGGFIRSRKFVRERLRFVESAQSPTAPIAAGVVAALAAAPVVFLLPVFGGVSAVLFGLGIGAGVAAGAKDNRRLPGS